MNIYSVDGLLIGEASILGEQSLQSKVQFIFCIIDRDYCELERIEGIKLEGYPGLWHIDCNVSYSTYNNKTMFEDGYFYK
jgi:hypothetical protein